MILLDLIKEIQKVDENFNFQEYVTRENIAEIIKNDDFSEVEKIIIKLRYFDLYSFADIALELGNMTRQRVAAINSRLPLKIAHHIRLQHSNNIYLEDLDVSMKTFIPLKRAGIKTIEEVLNLYKCGRIKQIKTIGNKAYKEIGNALKKLGYDVTVAPDKFRIKIENILLKRNMTKQELIAYLDENF